MLIRCNGGRAGVMEYLESGEMRERIATRDEMDTRVMLDGNFSLTKETIAGMQYTQNYYHITMSCTEQDIDNETLHAITEEAKTFFMQGYKRDEYQFYAEAHIPKIKTDPKGNARYPHVHIVIPRLNLLVNKQLKISENMNSDEKYRDAFQEYINLKYNLESPKDKPRAKKMQRDEILTRYTERDFSNMGATELKNTYTETIGAYAEMGKFKSVEDVMMFMRSQPTVTGVRYVDGKTGGYVSVAFHGLQKEVRFKGHLFDKNAFTPKEIPHAPSRKIEAYTHLLEEHTAKREKEVNKRYGFQRREHAEYFYTRIAQKIKERHGSFSISPSTVKNLAVLDSLYSLDTLDLPPDSVFLHNDITLRENEDGLILYNKNMHYRVVDKGHTIEIKYKYASVAVKSMLDMAEAKGWDINNLTITGSVAYIKEVKRQISLRNKEREQAALATAEGGPSVESVRDIVKEHKDEIMQEYSNYQSLLDRMRDNKTSLKAQEYSHDEYTRINTTIDPREILQKLPGTFKDVKRVFYSDDHSRFVIHTKSDHFHTLCDYVARKMGVPVREAMQRIHFADKGITRVPMVQDCRANVKDMRVAKHTIADAGYRREDMQRLVSDYYKKDRFEFLHKYSTDDIVYLVMPSTSGKNKIPELVAEQLQKDFGGQVLKDFAVPMHSKERKGTGVMTKLKNPSEYKLLYDLSALRGKRVFVVDDVFNTGEGFYALQKKLLFKGIEPDVVCLGSTSRQMTTDASIERFAHKISDHFSVSLETAREQLQFLKLTSATFAYQLERQFHGSLQDKAFIYDFIQHQSGVQQKIQRDREGSPVFHTGTVSRVREDGRGLQQGETGRSTKGRRDLLEVSDVVELLKKRESDTVTLHDIETLKRVNLVELLQRDGFEIIYYKSTKASTVLRKNDDLVSVSVKDGQYVYHNYSNPNDSGSIIDYIKNRYSSEKMVKVYETLQRIAERPLPTCDHSLLRAGKDKEIPKKKPTFDRDFGR